jgi:hypothetical protein
VNVACTFSHFTARGCVVVVGRLPVEIEVDDLRIPRPEDDEAHVGSRSEPT